MKWTGNNPYLRKSYLIVLFVVTIFFLLITCDNALRKENVEMNGFEQYAGSDKCTPCHQKVYDSHVLTQHFRSSAPANEHTVMGIFTNPENRLYYSSEAFIEMQKADSGLFQTAFVGDIEKKSARFDIVVGSGKKGQSFLGWNGDNLVQLPVTYFTSAAQWTSSPGYPANRIMFNRPVTSRCLECHSTYFQSKSSPDPKFEAFDRAKIIYAIDCEKCHGPAARHVDYQLKNPTIPTAKFIYNPAKLSRQQNLDLCGLCHGGRLTKTQPSFTFTVGDTLSKFFSIPPDAPDVSAIDVHGNQLNLLKASKCFIASQMTCSSCHNTHEKETNKPQLFSQRCISCHSDNGHNKICKLTKSEGSVINKNCVDCHMPKQASRSIAVNLKNSDTLTPVMMRTHFIKVYPGETSKVLKLLKSLK
jgi:hypothetical protein